MTKYLIKKGNHYASGLHFGVHFGLTEQKYKVRFSKECLYQPDCENDWNKLCGWSYGLHHKNSIRVCWRPEVIDNQVTGKIELCIYVYENEVRKISEHTKIVNIDKEYTFKLQCLTPNNGIKRDIGIIGLIGDTESDYLTITQDYSTKPSWGYFLYPYIGGDNVTTQDTRIYLERL